MKLLHISSVYKDLVEVFEKQNPNYKSLNYLDHLNQFMNFSRGQEFSYYYYLNLHGLKTDVFYINYVFNNCLETY